jgi:hypothetical protein
VETSEAHTLDASGTESGLVWSQSFPEYPNSIDTMVIAFEVIDNNTLLVIVRDDANVTWVHRLDANTGAPIARGGI